MSITLYEQQMAQIEMRDKILGGKTQADSGNLVDGPEAMEAIGKRHGVSL